jgi:redox-sensitive bicupin YhaK (pirin superfamily)
LKSTGHGAYVFVISGSVTIKDQTLSHRDAMGITDTDTFDITANTNSELVLFEVPMEIGFK